MTWLRWEFAVYIEESVRLFSVVRAPGLRHSVQVEHYEVVAPNNRESILRYLKWASSKVSAKKPLKNWSASLAMKPEYLA